MATYEKVEISIW